MRPPAVRPGVADVALLAALVLYPLYPKVGLVPVTGTYIPVRLDDVLTAIVALAWAAGLVRQRRAPVVPGTISALAGAWVICGLISLIIGAVILRSVPPLTGLAFWAKPLEYLLLGMIGFDLVRSRQLSVRAVLAAVFLGGAIVTGYGLLERLGLVPPFPFTTPIPGVLTSTIGDPHELASYLGLLLVFGVALWPSLNTRLRLLAAAGAVLAAWVMFNSGARSEYISALVVLLGMALWRPTRSIRTPAIAAAAVLAVVLISPLAMDMAASLTRGSSGQPPSGNTPTVTSRLGDRSLVSSLGTRFFVKWPAFLRDTARDPIFGLGPSAATEAADGYYIRSLLEFGIIGTAVFVALLLAIWRALRRHIDAETGLARDVAVGLLAATLFCAVVSILIDTWVASRVMELYWPLLGATLGTAAAQPSAARNPELAVA